MNSFVSRPLGDFITENSQKVTLAPTNSYPMAGISSYAQGLFEKQPISGAETGYKVFHRIKPKQVVLSTLKGWEGAITVADERFAGRFLPPHNLLFDVDEDLIKVEYIGWAIKCSKVWAALKHASKGMGARRETVNAADLLSIKIPVPRLTEQSSIIIRLNGAAAAIAARANTANKVSSEIDATLRATFARIIANAPRVTMGEIAPLVRRPVVIDPAKVYTEIGVRSFYRGLFERRHVLGSEFDWQKLFWIEEGDLVFSNLMAWEQATGIAQSGHAGAVGNHRMLTCQADTSRMSPNFLYYYFTTNEGHREVLRASPGTMVRNKTLSTKLLPNISVPMPSLDAQLWFDSLQAKACVAKTAQLEATTHLDQLLPAMLNEVFG